MVESQTPERSGACRPRNSFGPLISTGFGFAEWPGPPMSRRILSGQDGRARLLVKRAARLTVPPSAVRRSRNIENRRMAYGETAIRNRGATIITAEPMSAAVA